MHYFVVLEQEEAACGASVPALPGCFAVGDSREDALKLIREAIALHLEDVAPQSHADFEISVLEEPVS